jgi:proteasome lid subunit RPN8/RPN11
VIHLAGRIFTEGVLDSLRSLTGPWERCGFLVGDEQVASAFYEVRNLHAEPWQNYTIEMHQYEEALAFVRARGIQLVGIAHSHPARFAAQPSADDLADLQRIARVMPNAVHAIAHPRQITLFTVAEGQIEHQLIVPSAFPTGKPSNNPRARQ